MKKEAFDVSRRSGWSAAAPIEAALLMEEGVARVGHQLRNHLGAIRNAAFYLSKRCSSTELWKNEPRVAQFFKLIDDQLAAAAALTERGQLATAVHGHCIESITAEQLIRAALDVFADCPWAIPVTPTVAMGELLVDAAEVAYGIARLLAAIAVESGAETLTLDSVDHPEGYTITVSAIPRPSTKTLTDNETEWELGRLVARRMTVLCGAQFEYISDATKVSTRIVFAKGTDLGDFSDGEG